MGYKDRMQDKKQSAPRKQGSSGGSQDNWKGFVQCELNEAQKTAVKLLLSDPDKVSDSVFGLIDDLYKLSFSIDTYNGMYIVSATCKDTKSPNNGMTLTGRGGSMLGAMASLWYKHDVILDRNWGEASKPQARTVDADDVG